MSKTIKKTLIWSIKKIPMLSFIVLSSFFITYASAMIGLEYGEFLSDQVNRYSIMEVKATRAEVVKEYLYNEQVPEEVILKELYSLADRFNLNGGKWEKLVRCEATGKNGIDNLAKNPTSTALGTGQYLIKTWEATESFKQFKKARTDYKASLWEQALDLSTGEQDKWAECNKILGIYNYSK